MRNRSKTTISITPESNESRSGMTEWQKTRIRNSATPSRTRCLQGLFMAWRLRRSFYAS